MTNLIVVPADNQDINGPPFIINPNNEKSVDLILGISDPNVSLNVWIQPGKEIGEELSIRLRARFADMGGDEQEDWTNNDSGLVINYLAYSGEPNDNTLNIIYPQPTGALPLVVYPNFPIWRITKSFFLQYGSPYVCFKWTGSHWLLIATNTSA